MRAKCELCYALFDDIILKCLHYVTSHLCHICDTIHYNKAALRKHLKKVHGFKIYGCNLCCIKCETLRDLSLHLKIKHSNPIIFNVARFADKPYNCYTCGSRYSNSKNLTIHIKMAHIE
jgi:hypothetical protein